jgi:hypothetical protein
VEVNSKEKIDLMCLKRTEHPFRSQVGVNIGTRRQGVRRTIIQTRLLVRIKSESGLDLRSQRSIGERLIGERFLRVLVKLVALRPASFVNQAFKTLYVCWYFVTGGYLDDRRLQI